jgi:thiol-disulfide isomerase/thioredoxin
VAPVFPFKAAAGVSEFHVIGDAREPRQVLDAIRHKNVIILIRYKIEVEFMLNRLIIILLLIVAASICTAYAAQKAPGFALMNNKGEYVFKSKLAGNLIISFWASYCRPCRKEMPILIELEKKYGKIKNLKLVFINIDDNADISAKDKADRMLQDLDIVHEYLLDSYQITIAKYNPDKIVPATYLVNQKGDIVFCEVGARPDTLERLEKAISQLR